MAPIRRRNRVKGVQFTLMVVGASCLLRTFFSLLFEPCFIGASGTGRTTFVNTLCEADVLSHKEFDAPENAHVEEGIQIKPASVGGFLPIILLRFAPGLFCLPGCVLTYYFALELEEDGVRIALTIVDTPGFGDNIDNDHAYVPA